MACYSSGCLSNSLKACVSLSQFLFLRYEFFHLKYNYSWAGAMAKWLKVPGALPEDQGLIPSTHMVPQNHL